MPNTNMTMRIDEELKKQAEELFSDFGISVTAACTMFLKQAVREQRIPFGVSRNVPNSETVAAIQDVKRKINLSKSFHSIDELMEDLNA